jgi:hypothetical protein
MTTVPSVLLCPSPPVIPPHGLFEAFAPRIAALPARTPLARADLLDDAFLLARDAALELFYAPFDYVNPSARAVLVGIAPGWYQVERAFRAARDALVAGEPLHEASRLARTTASFSGPIRRNLVAMLDGIGLPEALGVISGWELWGARQDLLHTTAVVRYPVFVRGGNWTGYSPDPLRHPLLRRFATEALAAELAAVPRALVVPFGKSVAETLAHLVDAGALDASRCLPGLPHPSGANAHRPAQFAAVRERAAERVEAFFRS